MFVKRYSLCVVYDHLNYTDVGIDFTEVRNRIVFNNYYVCLRHNFELVKNIIWSCSTLMVKLTNKKMKTTIRHPIKLLLINKNYANEYTV